MSDESPNPATGGTAKKGAGTFDIRNIIGYLLGIYGVILLVSSFFGDQSLDKTGGVRANLWAGLALVVAALIFLAWARFKPITVPEAVDRPEPDPTRPAPRPKK